MDGVRGIMIIIVENWAQRTEFKTWARLFAFHITLIPLGKA